MNIVFLMLLFSASAFCFDNPYFMRSPKALLMGDAFTAVNDDEFTLFYNPATLGRPKTDFRLFPINPQISGTNVLNDMDKFDKFPDDPAGASKVLMNYPVHASAGFAPGFKLFNVGVSFIANESYDLLLRNPTHPMMDVDMRSDRGIMMGVGIPLGPSRLSRKTQNGSQTSIGIAGKYVERTGVQDTFALTGGRTMRALKEDKIEEIVKSIGHVKGRGYGFDTGLEHVVRGGGGQFVMGLSALDVGGTRFKVDKNEDKLSVANQRSQINFGMAAGQDFKIIHYILSADVRALNEEMDMGKRFRLGAELGLPGIKLMAGMNSGYVSYGAMLDLLILKVTAGFYDVELGTNYQQTQGKRFILYLSLFDFTFDA